MRQPDRTPAGFARWNEIAALQLQSSWGEQECTGMSASLTCCVSQRPLRTILTFSWTSYPGERTREKCVKCAVLSWNYQYKCTHSLQRNCILKFCFFSFYYISRMSYLTSFMKYTPPDSVMAKWNIKSAVKVVAHRETESLFVSMNISSLMTKDILKIF